MWRISLIDPTTQKLFDLGYDYNKSLAAQHTAISAPLTFSEAFNFMGVLDGKIADETLLALDQWVERWKHCRPYLEDKFAPTMGNVKLVMIELLNFARFHPQGTWKVEA